MNMPGPMTSNSYEKTVNVVTKSAHIFAEKTIPNAAEELKGEIHDGIIDVEISCDGSWQGRGYSSRNGVVTVI